MPAKRPALGKGLEALLGVGALRGVARIVQESNEAEAVPVDVSGSGEAPNSSPETVADSAAPESVTTPNLSDPSDSISSALASDSPATAPGATAASAPEPPGPRLERVPLDRIRPNPFQPRNNFDPEKLASLAASIKEQGVLQPLILRRAGDDRFEIVAGERRWRASGMAGLLEVPAVVRDFEDREMTLAAIVENIQRDDLNAIEESRAYETLAAEFGLTQEQIAQGVGKSRAAVANALRLLKLPDEIQDMVRHDLLTAGHARTLLSVSPEKEQLRLAREMANRGWSVREAERRTQPRSGRAAGGGEGKAGAGDGKSGRPVRRKLSLERDVADIQERMAAHVGLEVRIQPQSNSRGKVVVSYESLDEFQRLCDALGFAPS